MQTTTPPPPSSASPTLVGGDPTAVVGRRIGAFFVDALIGGLVLLVVVLATFTNTEFGSSITAELQCDIINDLSDDVCIQSGSTLYVGTADDMGAVVLVWLGVSIALTMILPGITGWSPGKRLLGLRIVDKETFEKAGFGANLLRGLLWVADGFPWLAPALGGVLLVSSDGHRRVGDFAAGTLVVRADAVGRPVPVAGVNDLTTTPPPSTTAVPSMPPINPPTSPPPPTTAPLSPPVPTSPPASAPPVDAAPPVFPPPTADPVPAAADSAPPQPTQRPGVDAPMWDDARDTYIQWDPELEAWMMWSEAAGRWVPISR